MPPRLPAVLLLFPLLSSSTPALRDAPLAASSLFYLDGDDWTVTAVGSSDPVPLEVGGHVPGDLVTDLELAGVIPDPLRANNTRGPSPVWDNATYTYTKLFDAPPGWDAATTLLVFDGVKMVADAFLNGHALGDFRSQFVRRILDVSALLLPSGNNLTVAFPTSLDPRNVAGRYMSASGAWDWAPWGETTTQVCAGCTQGAFTFTKGIWKSVYLAAVPASAAAITYVVPQVFLGAPGATLYPTSPLADGANGPWTVSVGVHFLAPGPVSGMLTVAGNWTSGGGGAAASIPVQLPSGNSTERVVLNASDVALWWPSGMGAQAQYSLLVTFTPSSSSSSSSQPSPVTASRLIGFRAAYLVTGNDTDPSTLSGRDGSGTFTLRYKVNGADLWARGSSLVPMEELEGRASDAAARRLVRSAAEGGMNLIRIWGGGIFQHDAFYEECDAAGLLILHDMMYAVAVWTGPIVFYHYPVNSTTDVDEITHQIRRLSAHPSIAVWTGCNECENAEYGSRYVPTLVTSLIAAEDPARPVWPACPSEGWASGVDMLTGLPNGSPAGLVSKVGPGPIISRGEGEGEEEEEAAVAAAAAIIGEGGAGGVAFPARRTVGWPRLTATTTAAAPLPSPSSPNCTFYPNADIPGYSTSAPSPSPDDCCALCYAAGPAVCWASVWYEGACYFKPGADNKTLTRSIGPVACWPFPRDGPLPFVPPEYHGPYYEPTGFTTISAPLPRPYDPWPAGMPVQLGPVVPLGVDKLGIFNSEFGMLAPASFESLAPSIDPGDWGLHGGEMYFRDWACDSTLETYFGVGIGNVSAFVERRGEAAFKGQLFLCALAQIVNMKNFLEARRAENYMGK
jgi:beta-mannosidase